MCPQAIAFWLLAEDGGGDSWAHPRRPGSGVLGRRQALWGISSPVPCSKLLSDARGATTWGQD